MKVSTERAVVVIVLRAQLCMDHCGVSKKKLGLLIFVFEPRIHRSADSWLSVHPSGRERGQTKGLPKLTAARKNPTKRQLRSVRPDHRAPTNPHKPTHTAKSFSTHANANHLQLPYPSSTEETAETLASLEARRWRGGGRGGGMAMWWPLKINPGPSGPLPPINLWLRLNPGQTPLWIGRTCVFVPSHPRGNSRRSESRMENGPFLLNP
ncbi:hypothetical protein AOLI_G00243450 [Acnodon oligacanthus]